MLRRMDRKSLLLGCSVIVLLPSVTLGQQDTSIECREALDNMINDANWMHVNTAQTNWCRLITENEFANCCQFAEFAKGKAEGCSECDADCHHVQMHDLCNEYFGKACTLERKPFHLTGAPDMLVSETFCLPKDCDNSVDRDNVVMWYHVQYQALRTPNSWNFDYEAAELHCPTIVLDVILITIGAVLGLISLLVLAWFLFKAPKERGQTLISQADMVEKDEDGEEEPRGDELRRTGLGDSQYGQPGAFNATYGSGAPMSNSRYG